jgi:hypothetical protein
MTDSRRLRWTDPVARMEKIRNADNILTGKLKIRKHLEGLGLDGRILL